MEMSKAMKIVNNRFDNHVKQAIKTFERKTGDRVQCRKGCNACCNMLVTISFAEAIRMYSVLSEAEIDEMLPRWLADSKFLADPSCSRDMYWKPCVFLKEGVCKIYNDRPFICRSHVSFSDPKWCSDPYTKNVKALDLNELVVKYSMKIGENEGVYGNPLMPMQYALLLVAHLERQEDGAGAINEMKRLSKTSALNLHRALTAWQHFMPGKLQKGFEPVYPLWDHFPEYL